MKRLGKTFILWVWVALALAAPGLGRPHFSRAAPLTWENPLVSPAANSHVAETNATLSISYAETLNPASITADATLVLHSPTHGKLGLTGLSVAGGLISAKSERSLKHGDLLEVTVKNTLQNQSGQSPAQATVWRFRTLVMPSDGTFVITKSAAAGIIWALEIGDLTGDGYNDIFVGTDEGDQIWELNGYGQLIDSGQRLGTQQRTVDAALGDLDNDGDLDALSIKYYRNLPVPAQVWLNDGSGSLSAGDALSSVTSQYRAAALGDLDGDGDLDAFTAGSFGSEVWLNDGAAHFSNSSQHLGTADNFAVALGDLDNDGDLDAFTATNGGLPDRVWLNNGAGLFADSGQSLGSEFGYAAALGDLDNDGDLDALVGNGGSTPGGKLWINDGAAGFSSAAQTLGSAATMAVAIADIDGDNDLDVITGAQGGTVWRNQGSLNFSDTGAVLASTDSDALAVGSLAGLGRMDIALEANTLQIARNTRPATCESICLRDNCPVACVSSCTTPAAPAAGEPKRPAALQTDTFYAVRDQVLGQTAAGQHLRDLYYTHGPEIVRLLLLNPALLSEAAAVLEQWQPNLQALFNGQGGSTSISAAQVQAVQDFLSHLSAAGSPALQQVITAELAALPPLTSFTGKSMAQARKELVGFGQFLPTVRR